MGDYGHRYIPGSARDLREPSEALTIEIQRTMEMPLVTPEMVAKYKFPMPVDGEFTGFVGPTITEITYKPSSQLMINGYRRVRPALLPLIIILKACAAIFRALGDPPGSCPACPADHTCGRH